MRGSLKRRLTAAIAVSIAALVLAAPAPGWFQKLDSFTGSQGGSKATQRVTIRKCKGGPSGTYRLLGIVFADTVGSDGDVFHRVQANLSARGSWVPLRDISVELEGPDTLDPQITAQLIEDFATFYDTIETRVKKDQLEAKHGKLVILGTKVLGPETFIQEFEPKPTCPDLD